MIVIDFLKSESIKLPSEKYLTLVSCEITNNSCGLHNLIVKIVNYPNDKITRFFLEIFKCYNTCLTESFWNITKAVYPWAIEILYIFCVQACIPEWVAESLWLIKKILSNIYWSLKKALKILVFLNKMTFYDVCIFALDLGYLPCSLCTF